MRAGCISPLQVGAGPGWDDAQGQVGAEVPGLAGAWRGTGEAAAPWRGERLAHRGRRQRNGGESAAERAA